MSGASRNRGSQDADWDGQQGGIGQGLESHCAHRQYREVDSKRRDDNEEVDDVEHSWLRMRDARMALEDVTAAVGIDA